MKQVRAVDRAIDGLLFLSAARRSVAISELERGLQLSRPTLYRMLQTLIDRELVRAEGEPPRYTLDFGVLKLAESWSVQSDVMLASEQPLAELWNRTDETVALAIPHDDHGWLLAKEFKSRQPLSYGRGIGHAQPLIVGASGRVMLAFFDAAKTETILAREPDAAKRESIRAQLDAIRSDGYAAAAGELILGAMAIAAPVFDHRGSVVAAVCLYGPEIRLKDLAPHRYVPLARTAAEKISRILGHVGSRAPGAAPRIAS
jgi:DNA-binding IclR family transcriptional regulator